MKEKEDDSKGIEPITKMKEKEDDSKGIEPIFLPIWPI